MNQIECKKNYKMYKQFLEQGKVSIFKISKQRRYQKFIQRV